MFAFSGVLNRPPGEKRDPALLEYAVDLAAGDPQEEPGQSPLTLTVTGRGIL